MELLAELECLHAPPPGPKNGGGRLSEELEVEQPLSASPLTPDPEPQADPERGEGLVDGMREGGAELHWLLHWLRGGELKSSDRYWPRRVGAPALALLLLLLLSDSCMGGGRVKLKE